MPQRPYGMSDFIQSPSTNSLACKHRYSVVLQVSIKTYILHFGLNRILKISILSYQVCWTWFCLKVLKLSRCVSFIAHTYGFFFFNGSVWPFPEQLVPFHAAAHKACRRVIVFYRASTTRLILECLIRSVKCDCNVFFCIFFFPSYHTTHRKLCSWRWWRGAGNL